MSALYRRDRTNAIVKSKKNKISFRKSEKIGKKQTIFLKKKKMRKEYEKQSEIDYICSCGKDGKKGRIPEGDCERILQNLGILRHKALKKGKEKFFF